MKKSRRTSGRRSASFDLASDRGFEFGISRVREQLAFQFQALMIDNGLWTGYGSTNRHRIRDSFRPRAITLPEGVNRRLQSLLDRQDAGETLTEGERVEAEGLVDLADFLALLKLRAIRVAKKEAP